MMWHLHLMLEWAMSQRGSNLIFALLCSWQLTGLAPRRLETATVLLHILLALT